MKNFSQFIFLVSILAFQNIFAIEIISLGDRCVIAYAARYNNLRTTAYPFDWMFTTTKALTNAIQDDFKQVLIPEQTDKRDNNKAVIDGYGLIFCHDFPTVLNPVTPIDNDIISPGDLILNWRDSIDIVKAKFNRRLERFLKLLHDGTPVALVRYGVMNRVEAEQFVALLQEKYPYAKAVLVVIGSTSEFQESWNISHVRNLYIDKKDFRPWNGLPWTNIMHEIAAMKPTNWSDDTHTPNN